jgi:hypothetical protein
MSLQREFRRLRILLRLHKNFLCNLIDTKHKVNICF